MYVFGFLASYLLVRYQMKKKDFNLSRPEVENLYFYLILGLMIGADWDMSSFTISRLISLIPLRLLPFGMGHVLSWRLIGVLLVGVLFSWRNRKSFWKIADLVIVTAPLDWAWEGLVISSMVSFMAG